jgi:hypothetical protein
MVSAAMVSAAIAAIFDWMYGIKGKAHGQECTVRGYRLEFGKICGGIR